MTANLQTKSNEWYYGQIGWKCYHQIKKKATEQEFSWSGLVISLSVAFFIVISSSLALSLFYRSVEKVYAGQETPVPAYRLEAADGYLNYLANNHLCAEKPYTA